MTNVIYVASKGGKVVETKSYREAQKLKAEGWNYTVRYEEKKTY